MSWIKTFTEALNQSLKTKLDKKEAFGIFAKKTELFSRDYKDLKNKPNYAVVARTGSYKDLDDQIPYITKNTELSRYSMIYRDSYDEESAIKDLSMRMTYDNSIKNRHSRKYYFIDGNSFIGPEGDKIAIISLSPYDLEFGSISTSDVTFLDTSDITDPSIRIESFMLKNYMSVANGKIFFNSSYPKYELYSVDLESRYFGADGKYYVKPEKIEVPVSVYDNKQTRCLVTKVVYFKENYYMFFDKNKYSFGENVTTVYKTSDFVTFEETPMKLITTGPYEQPVAYKNLIVCNDCLICIPNRSVEDCYITEDGSTWKTFKNPRQESEWDIKTVFCDDTHGLIYANSGTSYTHIGVASVADILSEVEEPWSILKQPPEFNFNDTYSYIEHFPDEHITIIAKAFSGFYYSYDGYHWHFIAYSSDNGTVSFIMPTDGDYIYHQYNYETDTTEFVKMNAGLVKADPIYGGFHDITGEVSVMVFDKMGYPEAPLNDGTYNLKCTVVDGAPTYTWEEVTEYETLEGGDY